MAFCRLPRMWIDSKYTVTFVADAPAVDGYIVVAPKK